MQSPDALQMGLSPLHGKLWIETDCDLPRYYAHKLQQREQAGNTVYRATDTSLPAQQELAELLLAHLLHEQAPWFQREHDQLQYRPAQLFLPLAKEEPLWQSSLWVADDLVIMAPVKDDFQLIAASLCSPSHWRLAEKFGCALSDIHAPVPGLQQSLTPSINRFLRHLKPEHTVVRYNWSLQSGNELHPPRESEQPVVPGAPLYYRTERQTLRRLPKTGAIAFTIRVYLHPLASLHATPGAMQALLVAVDATPSALAHYKGFDQLRDALQRYRRIEH